MVLSQGSRRDCYLVSALGLTGSRMDGRRRLAGSLRLMDNGQVKMTLPRFPDSPIVLGKPHLIPRTRPWQETVALSNGVQGPLGIRILERGMLTFLKDSDELPDNGGNPQDVLWMLGYDRLPGWSLKGLKTETDRAAHDDVMRSVLHTLSHMSQDPERYLVVASRDPKKGNPFLQFPPNHAYGTSVTPEHDRITTIDPHETNRKKKDLDPASFFEIFDHVLPVEATYDPD